MHILVESTDSYRPGICWIPAVETPSIILIPVASRTRPLRNLSILHLRYLMSGHFLLVTAGDIRFFTSSKCRAVTVGIYFSLRPVYR
jgi:hypothetical protein